MVNYKKIIKNFTFWFIMKDAGVEACTMHNHSPPVNEIVWEFYINLNH